MFNESLIHVSYTKIGGIYVKLLGADVSLLFFD